MIIALQLLQGDYSGLDSDIDWNTDDELEIESFQPSCSTVVPSGQTITAGSVEVIFFCTFFLVGSYLYITKLGDQCIITCIFEKNASRNKILDRKWKIF